MPPPTTTRPRPSRGTRVITQDQLDDLYDILDANFQAYLDMMERFRQIAEGKLRDAAREALLSFFQDISNSTTFAEWWRNFLAYLVALRYWAQRLQDQRGEWDRWMEGLRDCRPICPPDPPPPPDFSPNWAALLAGGQPTPPTT